MSQNRVKRVLVTGASGRIGRVLVPKLLSRGYRVSALVHRKSLPPEWQNEVDVVASPMTSADGVSEALDGADVVCHLAGLMPPNPDEDIFHTNIEATWRLLQAAAAATSKPRFVFASSDATYCTGWSKNAWSAPIGEEASQHPMNFYGLSKVIGEKLCYHFEDIYKVPTVRVRLVWILEAPEVMDLFIGAPYREFLVQGDKEVWDKPNIVQLPLEENGNPFREHICDVRDAAEGVLLAVEKEDALGEVFNIAGPAAFTYTDAAPWLAKHLGVEAISGRCKGLHSYEVSIEKAHAILGYQPKFSVYQSLEDALLQRTLIPLKA